VPGKILSVGFLVEPLLRRSAGLSREGFTVETISNAAKAARSLRETEYDALVLGPAIPEPLRNSLALTARRRNLHIAIVMLYSGSIDNAEQADAVLNASTAEQNLAEAIRHVMGLKRRKAEPQLSAG
jgi:DNA-binding NtrC family response regulator